MGTEIKKLIGIAEHKRRTEAMEEYEDSRTKVPESIKGLAIPKLSRSVILLNPQGQFAVSPIVNMVKEEEKNQITQVNRKQLKN